MLEVEGRAMEVDRHLIESGISPQPMDGNTKQVACGHRCDVVVVVMHTDAE